MKKILALVFVIVMALCLSGCEGKTVLNANVGDVVEFGRYDGNDIKWRCLSVDGKKRLFITEYGIETRDYHNKTEDITWENCELRKWLNEKFLGQAFSSTEKEQIILTHNINPNNREYGSYGGNDTDDRIFCLSVDEAVKYLKNEKEMSCLPSDSLKQRYQKGSFSGWHLRSPGQTQNRALSVGANDGSIDYEGGGVGPNRVCIMMEIYSMVRPAIWVKGE